MYIWQTNDIVTNILSEDLTKSFTEYNIACSCMSPKHMSDVQLTASEDMMYSKAQDKIQGLIGTATTIYWPEYPTIDYHGGMAHISFRMCIE